MTGPLTWVRGRRQARREQAVLDQIRLAVSVAVMRSAATPDADRYGELLRAREAVTL